MDFAEVAWRLLFLLCPPCLFALRANLRHRREPHSYIHTNGYLMLSR